MHRRKIKTFIVVGTLLALIGSCRNPVFLGGDTPLLVDQETGDPMISILLPCADDVWFLGQNNAVIHWTTTAVSSEVAIFLYNNEGEVIQVESRTINDGLATFDVPFGMAAGDDYRIRISSLEDDTLYAFSGVFSIESTSSLAVSVPYSSSVWTSMDSTCSIRWIPGSHVERVTIELHDDSRLVHVFANAVANTGEYEVPFPEFLSFGTAYRVVVRDPYDVRNVSVGEAFSIIPTPSIQITYPHIDAPWYTGQHTIELEWTSNYIAEDFQIDLLADEQLVVTLVKSALPGRVLVDLPVDLSPDKQYKIRISDEQHRNIMVTSDPIGIVDHSPHVPISGDLFNVDDYNGIIAPKAGAKRLTGMPIATFSDPLYDNFITDAWFPLSGSVVAGHTTGYLLMRVQSEAGPQDQYWLSGDFDLPVFLRYGAGNYSITIWEATSVSTNEMGVIQSYTVNYWPICNLNVQNINPYDGRYCYPSPMVQSASPSLHNIAVNFQSATTDDLIKEVHDWVARFLRYDNLSLYGSYRKPQDALSVLDSGTAVCDGYTLLFMALLRARSIPVRYIYGYAGGGHSWVLVSNGKDWKYVDPTWGDQITAGHNHFTDGSNIIYNYFWQDDLPDRTIYSTELPM